MIVGMAFEYMKEHVLANEHYQALERKLVTLGGEELVYMPAEPELLDYITQRGQSFPVVGMKKIRGQISRCHDNVIEQWAAHKDRYRMVHGYGLSADGLWRSHSWLLDRHNTVVETTVPRIAYYGIILEGKLAEWFAEE